MPHGVKVARHPACRGQKVSIGQHVAAVQLGDRQSVDDADAYQVGDGSPFLHFGCAFLLRGGEVAIPGLWFVGGCPVAVETGLLVLDQPVVARANDAEQNECVDGQPCSEPCVRSCRQGGTPRLRLVVGIAGNPTILIAFAGVALQPVQQPAQPESGAAAGFRLTAVLLTHPRHHQWKPGGDGALALRGGDGVSEPRMVLGGRRQRRQHLDGVVSERGRTLH